MRIAIIGSGISGLSASYILSCDENHQVTLFERGDHIGFDAHSLDLGSKRVDSPPRTFSVPFYRNLMNLYRESGVEYKERVWSYTISYLGQVSAWFKAGHWVFLNFRLPKLGSQVFSLTTWRVIYDGFRFSRSILQEAKLTTYSSVTLRQYLHNGKYSDEFIYSGLLPILSMICTCSYEACLNYPVDIIMRYMAVSGTKGQFSTRYGTSDAADRLTRHVDQIHLNAAISRVWRSDSGAQIEYKINKETKIESFDHVIIASQASAALTMIQDPSETEREVLSMFTHEFSDVVVHRDERLMPPNRQDWSAANFIIDKTNRSAMTTLWATEMMKLDRSQVGDVFQSWNPIVPIDPSKVMLQVRFERPLMTVNSLPAIQKLQQIQGLGGIWYCGAYATYSLPLQESCVESAIHVAEQIGIRVPWKRNRWYDDHDEDKSTWLCIGLGAITVQVMFLMIAQRLG